MEWMIRVTDSALIFINDTAIRLAVGLLLMSLTGSIVLLIWYTLGKYFKKLGYMPVFYHLLKIAVVMFLVPLYIPVYAVVHECRGGFLFELTPWIACCARVLCLLWFLGILIFGRRVALRQRTANEICQEKITCEQDKQLYFDDVCRRMGIREGKVKLFQSYRIHTPRLAGMISPVVILPVRTYTEQELDVIFTHELTHYKHKDILFKRLGMFAGVIHFFNPAAWIIQKYINRFSEYACDYSACEKTGGMRRYFGTILEMTEKTDEKAYFTAQVLENKHELLERVEFMKTCRQVKRKHFGKAVALGMAIAMTVSVSVFAATAAAAEGYNSLYRITESAVEEEAIHMEEHYEAAGTGPVVSERIGETEKLSRSTDSFTWKVGGRELVKTEEFYVSSGSSISVFVDITPTDLNVKAGIMDNKNNKRYVEGSDCVAGSFKITKSGMYRVFVENNNSESVTADGSYRVK